jgi:hypothetical protein
MIGILTPVHEPSILAQGVDEGDDLEDIVLV